MKIHRLGFALAFLVVSTALVAVPACKTNTIDNGTNNNTNNTTSNVIGAAGGVITGPNGVSVRVPGGALSGDTRISISIAGPDEYPPLNEQVSAVYAFEPHGLKFLSPVTISLPGNASNGGTVLHAEVGDAQWSALNGNVTLTSTGAEILVPTFSFYALSTGGGPNAGTKAPTSPTPPPSGTGSGGSSGSSGSSGGTGTDCGRPGLACCTSGVPCGDATTACLDGICKPCGNGGMTCCPGDTCVPPFVCSASQCIECGKAGQACCTTGAPCSAGLTCDALKKVCAP